MLFLRFAAHCVALLCLCASSPGRSQHCISFAYPIYAMPFHHIANQCIASPLQIKSMLICAMPLLLVSRPSRAFPLLFQAMQCLCYSARSQAIPSLFVARQRCAFPLPFHASPLLLFSMPRLAFPLLFSATLLSAYQFLCRSIHCDDVPLRFILILRCANPLRIRSWRSAAFALLSCALPCHSLLCPCVAVQETSAQRKRPLPELRHWPRPR